MKLITERNGYMRIQFSEIIDIFDEFMYPTFYSYKAEMNGKKLLYLSLFAYFDKEKGKDYFLNVPVSKKMYTQLIEARVEIRSLFLNNKNKFFTENSPEKIHFIEPVHLDINANDYLPEQSLFLLKFNDELENEENIHDLFKQNIGKQLYNKEYDKKEGLMIAFSNNDHLIRADTLGTLIKQTSELFNKISDNLLSLNVVKPFESSFGISMEIDSETLNINNNDFYINRFLNLFNLVSKSREDENFNDIISMYTTKEKEKLIGIFEELISNNVEMKSIYYNKNKKENNYKGNIINLESAKKFMSSVNTTKETKKKIYLKDAYIYKIDVKNNSFGILIKDIIYTGKLSISLQDKEQTQFTVPSVKNVVLTEIIKTDEFTNKEKISYVFESLN
ncbi:DUF6575 domain-containing protein [Mammaliicoccus sciuri]|uniref:DUF6575 domain-containing protein n=2 Tax=Mammaliicoccus sciuri TaxID=1296 RepID=UPI0029057266|nr:DUF6575 domain-containing protein [Mammaliicoccus sciuri]